MDNDINRGGCSASKLKIISFNANSIGKHPKRRQVLCFLKKKNPDLLLIVDTRFSKDIENSVKTEWGGQVLFSSFSSQSRGVAIFIRKNLPIKILDKFNDGEGNLLCLLIEYEGKKIILEGLYGPNLDCPNFFKNEVFQRIDDWNPHHSIFVGDWNLVLNQNNDTLNYQSTNNPLAKNEVIRNMNQHNLIDVFRELHPNAKTFTWKQWGSKKFARLDFFLVSDSLMPFIEKAEILPSVFSDHSPVVLEIDFSKFTRGRGFWKFNNSLLKDSKYVDLIKSLIKRVVCQYASQDIIDFIGSSQETISQFLSEQTPESLQALELQINPELFLDTLLMEIRGATIKYCSEKKRNNKAKEQLLINDIELLERQFQSNPDIEEAHIKELEEKKEAFEQLIKHEAEGAFVRSRAKYKLEGEKPTRMFCALERHNGVQRYVPQLLVEKDDASEVELISKQSEVEAEIKRYYKCLFSNKDQINDDSIEAFLGPSSNSIPKLSESQKVGMEGKISLEEMSKYLRKCKNNVAPGSSGFTFDFYKFFWRDIKQFVLRSVDHSFENNRLSVSQRLGIISIIPKGEKDKRFLKNWRPLCLLNSLYKIVSGALAERIKPSLDFIIHGDQKGFIAGRYIGEVVRTTFDIIQYAKEANRTGVLLLIDFEKAYDSISFKFINKALKFLNFGEDLIRWINILLNNFKAVINHCGNVSDSFIIERGCRQGDPIACYLFIICIEFLAHKLREDEEVKGFEVEGCPHLLEMYADDLSLFLSPKAESLRKVVKILDNFYKISGLKISVNKTKAVWFGPNFDSASRLCPELNLEWVRNFTLLGINFSNNLIGMDSNFTGKIEEIEKMLGGWFYRYLTPYGKIVIIKTLALSKLGHLALVVPNPSKQMFKQIETMFFRFIWNNKSEKVSREHAKLTEKCGGLNVPDVEDFWLSFKFSWLRRLLRTSSFWPNIIMCQISKIYNQTINPSQLLQLGPSLLYNISKKINNTFWRQVLMSAQKVAEGAIFTQPEKIGSTSFWHNPLIKRNNKSLTPEMFLEIAGSVSILSDFFYSNTNDLMNREDFCTKYNLEVAENNFVEIRYIIKTALQKIGCPLNKVLPVSHPNKPLLIDVALATLKGCSFYYKLLRTKKNLKNCMGAREQKWHGELGVLYSVDFWEKSRKLCASINFENPIKWLQFQIIRNSLQTNYIISHFIQNVNPECKFCLLSSETISHIYWICPIVGQFLEEVFVFISNAGTDFRPNMKQFLFGYVNENFNTPRNYLILWLKKFIWNCKFKGIGNLSIVGFKKFLLNALRDLKNLYELEKKENTPAYFNELNNLYLLLEADNPHDGPQVAGVHDLLFQAAPP